MIKSPLSFPLISRGGTGSLSIIKPLIYLLRDLFSTDDAAPISSPRTCEPGPGTLVFNDGSNRWDISNGLVVPNGATVGTGNPGVYSGAFTRKAGLCFKSTIRQISAYGTDANKTVTPMVGWTKVQSSSNLTDYEAIVWSSVTGTFTSKKFGSSNIPVVKVTCLADTDYVIRAILRDTGMFILVNSTLAWVFNNDNTATLYAAAAAIGTNRHPHQVSKASVRQLGAPWDSDYGPATYHPASVSGGETFTHEANCLVDFIVDSLPSSGDILVKFREEDSNNYWQIKITSAGAISLDEVISGSPTTRMSSTGVVATDRIVCIADGSVYTMRRNETQVGSYTGNVNTNTGGEIALGTGGGLSAFCVWPRYPVL